MVLISIDGACRRNGSPTCVAAGGVFIQHMPEKYLTTTSHTLSVPERHSTNQRGELLALLTALEHVQGIQYINEPDNRYVYIVTDSEYLFNAMTKGWYNTWHNNNWLNAVGEQVKNKDLWSRIYHAYNACVDRGIEIMFYHIKGHVIPFGKVTAAKLLADDNSGKMLAEAVSKKYDEVSTIVPSCKKRLQHATELSERNNGFALPPDTLKLFVVANIVADTVATECVEAEDKRR